MPISATSVSESVIRVLTELVVASATCSVLYVSRDSIISDDCWS